MKVLYPPIWKAVAALLLLVGLSSCKEALSDSLEYCPRGVFLHVYEQTPCATAPSYPDVRHLTVFAFDAQGTYAFTHQVDVPGLASDREILVPVNDPGQYTFVVWGGLLDRFYDIAKLVPGTTTVRDLLFALRSSEGITADIRRSELFYGTTAQVEIGEEINHYVHVDARLQELTNRIAVTLSPLVEPIDFDVRISAANTRYTVEGQMLPSDRILYPTSKEYPSEHQLLTRTTILHQDPIAETFIEVVDPRTGDVIWSDGLTAHLYRYASLAGVDLKCIHDFEIDLTVRRLPDGNYAVTTLAINNWGVHSYDIELR